MEPSENLTKGALNRFSGLKFVGRLDNMKNFYNGIKALHFGGISVVAISKEGLRLTVENGKTIQASLFITASSFVEYHLENDLIFGINIKVLIECLGVFGNSVCAMKMYYKGNGAPLVIALEPHNEENISTECILKTSVYEELLEFAIEKNSSSLNFICFRGLELAKVFRDIDKSATELVITLSPRSPFFRIDILGVMQVDMSYEVTKSSRIILHFDCHEETKARYKYSEIKLIGKALAASQKVAIRTDASGLLEFQFMIYGDEDSETYLEFFLMPVVE